MVRPRLSLFQGAENSPASKSPTRLGFFLHLLSPWAKQARQPSPSEDLKPPPLTLFPLLSSPWSCPGIPASLNPPAFHPWEMSALKEEAMQATHPSVTIRPLSPSYGVPASLSSILGQKKLYLWGKCFKTSWMGKWRKNAKDRGVWWGPVAYSAYAAAKSLQSCLTVQPHRWQPTRLPRPWDSPGKNTGVGCHFLIQCMKVKSESEVAQSCPTLSDPMDYSPPGPPSMGFSRQKYWSGVPLPSPILPIG